MTARRRRTVVVSGSASGIGAAIRGRFERSGARVVGIDRRGAEVNADLGAVQGRQEALAAVTELTEGRVDGVVACAGLGPHTRPTEHIAQVNYFGALGMLDGLLLALRVGEAPAAVAMSSNSAGITPPHQGLLEALAAGDEETAGALARVLDGATVYGMTKLALARAVRRRAADWGAAGVRLNALAPGPVETPLLRATLQDPVLGPLVEGLPVPLARRATPEEIAGAVAFLLDPVNGFVHGSVLFIDGGSDAQLRPDAV
ncbi:MAG: SDR family oxidoreductase [Acidimicrobiales bacterium]